MKPPFSSLKVQTVYVLSSNKRNNSRKKFLPKCTFVPWRMFFFSLLIFKWSHCAVNMKTPLFCQVSKCGGFVSYTLSFVEQNLSITGPWGFVCTKAISVGFVDDAFLVFYCLYVEIESKQNKFLCVCMFLLNTWYDVLWPSCFLQLRFSEDDLSVFS